MATPILDSLSISLSRKIFDPVESATSDGKIFTKSMRIEYLDRAYTKLVRLIETYHPEIVDIFPDYYTIINLQFNSESKLILSDSTYRIEDLYYTESNDYSILKKANPLPATSYHPKKAELSLLELPEFEQRYWTLIGNEIKLLPSDTNLYKSDGFEILVRGYFPAYIQGGENDFQVPKDLHDIILSIAAAEASLDRGRAQFYQAYKGDYMSDIKTFADRWTSKNKDREGK